jgi:FkbM family methyltransferase
MLWLKAWIAFCRPRGANPYQWKHYFAAAVTLPAIVVLYLLLIVRLRLRGPLVLPGMIPSGATLNCQLPDIVQFNVFLFGVWEPDITAFMRRRLSAGDTFCDIGSHVGYYSLLAATRVLPDGRVVAVEASPTIFEQLRKNLERNQAVNVRAVNIAAAAEPGAMNVHCGPAWNLGWTTTRTDRGLPHECLVPALPLNDILTAEERRTLRLIKVDVEGTERELFPALLQLLRESRSDAEAILEVSPRWWKESSQTVEQAVQPFLEAGFYLYLVDNNYSPWRYFWSEIVRPPQRVRGALNSWIGQYDIVLSRLDQEQL